MITHKQLDSLYQIINTKQQTLEKINDKFVKTYGNQSYNLFRPCHTITNLLSLNLLTKLQRIISIYLILQSFRVEGIRKNPFAFIIIQIFQKTNQQYQRKYIGDLIIDNKRQKYAKQKLDNILQQYQQYQDIYKNKQQIEAIKKAFIQNTPKLSPSTHSQIKKNIADFNQKKPYPIQIPINKQSIKQAQLSNDGFNIGFMRPIPKLIQINANQFFWVSPNIITDVNWDNSIEKQKRYTKLKQCFKKAETTPLTSQQAKETKKILEDYPYLIFNIQISPDNLAQIVIKNPFIAVDILVGLVCSPQIRFYIQKLIDIPLNINSMDVMAKFIEKCRIDRRIINFYVIKKMQQCKGMPSVDGNQQKFARIISVFTKSMINGKQIQGKDIEKHIKQFLTKFPNVPEVIALNKMICQ